ncbi:MAG: OmpA family protein [Saprospiraceae bacterium]|nr:OmpA family protein [Saprospiraceae bacterium]MDW8484294.1 OmpA family protein [Saprospiraceae bacterium]
MNPRIRFSVHLLLFALATYPLTADAQQSGKSKSKDRFREKSALGREPIVRQAAAICGPGADYPSAYLNQQLVFVSNSARTGKEGSNYKNRPSFDLYVALLDGNEEAMPPRQPFSEEMNSSLNEGQVTFARQGKYILFTRNNNRGGVQKAGADGRVRMKIYQARRGKYDWEDIRELPFNHDDYSCMHPSLSVDGQRLYFASDMPGGHGGFDLYVCRRQPDGTWSAPENLGPRVNTEKNEIFPFITFGGKTLLFASDGHKGLGGLDIFSINVDNLEEGPLNLNEPFNSKEDDFAMILNEDGTRGFFASRREGGFGDADIYSFWMESALENIEKPQANRVVISVIDGRTGQPIPKAEVRILQSTDDGFVSRRNDFYYTELAPVSDAPNSLTLRIVRKDAEALGPPDLITNVEGKASVDFTLYRSYLILASFDGYQTAERLYTMEPDKGGEIVVALFEQPSCHRMTGIISTDKFNTRIPNAVLLFTHKESNRQVVVHSDLNGEYNICLPLEGEYLVQVKREGFKPQFVTTTAIRGKSVNTIIRLEPADLTLATSADAAKTEALLARPLQDGYVITIDNIRFEPGRASLNRSFVQYLDALAELMQRYPEMEIDLVVHTDARGDAKANLALSEERANNAKAYLVYKGIAADRIQPIGKGDSQPRNHCARGVACTDAEHDINNRLEVKVRKVGLRVRTP